MNLLQLLKSQFKTEKALAKIIGSKGNATWVGEKGNGIVLLTSQNNYTIGQYVYYDRATGEILGLAPDLQWQEWGV